MMPDQTLVERIDRIEFSDEAGAEFLHLVDRSIETEGGAVVLAAAASLLVREHQGPRSSDAELARLGGEFIQLMFAVRDQCAEHRQGRVHGLRVVGGIDA